MIAYKLTPKRKEIMESLHLDSLFSLLRYYPYRYDHLYLSSLTLQEHEQKVTIQGTICSEIKTQVYGHKKCKTTFEIEYENKKVTIYLFNRMKWSSILKKGTHVVVTGKFHAYRLEVVASSFFVGFLDHEKWIPIYTLPQTIKAQTFQNFMEWTLKQYQKENIQNVIPQEFILKYRLISLKESLQYIHFPQTKAQLHQAQRHLKYEEFLNFCTIGALKRKILQKSGEKQSKIWNKKVLENVIKQLPFSLSEDQKNVLKEILQDLQSTSHMNRLVQGDVGSGKTMVALFALVANYSANYQGALMAPTDILAKQHYQTFKQILDPLSINVYLLVSNMSKSEKESVLKKVSEEKPVIIIGTHALIQENIQFRNLGLAVIDEQHRFGVQQRLKLKEKGNQVDILYMSATPIPRTLASTLYLDMDVSTIAQFPYQKRQVVTKFISTNQIQILKKELENYLKETDGKIYIVCPSIEEGTLELKNVESVVQEIKKLFPSYPSVYLHGKLKSEEKNQVMNEFLTGEARILIATTVIEVGVHVSEANRMIILNAERFGLAQLHQLRGRIGRSGTKAYCYLCSDSKDQEVIERLQFLAANDDGFKISEYDLSKRGPGELFGLKQSGLLQFKIANIIDDYAILKVASKDAQFIVQHDKDFMQYIQYIKKRIKASSLVMMN